MSADTWSMTIIVILPRLRRVAARAPARHGQDGSAPVAAVDVRVITPPRPCNPRRQAIPQPIRPQRLATRRAAWTHRRRCCSWRRTSASPDFERDVLLLCAAIELDPEMSAHLPAAARSAGAPTRLRPRQRYWPTELDALHAPAVCVNLRLLEINQPGANAADRRRH